MNNIREGQYPAIILESSLDKGIDQSILSILVNYYDCYSNYDLKTHLISITISPKNRNLVICELKNLIPNLRLGATDEEIIKGISSYIGKFVVLSVRDKNKGTSIFKEEILYNNTNFNITKGNITNVNLPANQDIKVKDNSVQTTKLSGTV